MKKIRFFVNTILLVAAVMIFATSVFADADLQAAAASEESNTSEELLQGYFDEVFLENCVIESPKDVPTLKAANRKAAMRKALSPASQVVYDVVKEGVSKVAAGTETYTVFHVPMQSLMQEVFGVKRVPKSMSGAGSAKEVYNSIYTALDIQGILNALLVDIPYELYWFEKTFDQAFFPIDTSTLYSSGNYFYFKSDACIDIYMQVAPEYRSEDSAAKAVKSGKVTAYMYLRTDAAKTSLPKRAAENAGKVQKANVGKTDLEKLTAYRDYICEKASYNHSADSATAYGNPWQMIWVFDEDPDTEVVCEGYAKAFQYLCDRSRFSLSDVGSILVSGFISGGAHMWNIVTMEDGKNYLVDLTNCDEKKNLNYLFLRGGQKSEESVSYNQDGYWGYKINTALNSISGYFYDEETISTYYEKELLLSADPYLDHTTHVESVSLSGTRTIYTGDKLKLQANILPLDATHKDVVWSVSDSSIASISSDGTLTAKKKGIVTVTVATRDRDMEAVGAVTILQHATGIEIRSGSTAVSGETTLYVGDKALSLSAVVTPSNAESLDYHWTISGDESSAQIDKTSAGYTITAKKEGVLTVKAISDESPSVSKTLKIRMLVKKVPVTPEKEAAKGSAVEKASAAIVSGGEEGPAGSSFRPLKARVYKTKKNSVTIRWKKVSGASAYVIFGNRCGKSRKFKKLAEVKASQWKWTYKKLKKGCAYKFIVMAVKGNGTARTVLTTSKTVHAYTAGGTYGNYKSIKLNKKSVTLKTGKTFKLKVTAVSKGGKIKIHRRICYESSNTDIATVSSKGKIKAKAAGTCYVFAYAQDGTYKSIKVRVKKAG